MTDPAPESLERYQRWWVQNHPVEFIETALGTKLDPQAREMVKWGADEYNVAAVGGHNTRKDYTLCALEAWELIALAPVTLICTGPVLDRVKQVQMHYLKEILGRGNLPPDTYVGGEEKIKFPGVGSEVWAITTMSKDDRGDTMARFTGMHRPRLRIHVTEATSVPHSIWTQLQSLGSNPDVRFRVTMNAIYSPGHWSNKLIKAHPPEAGVPAGRWKTFRFSSYDSPYCSKDWIQERVEEWGADSVLFKGRVLGIFPDESEMVLIPESFINEATDREVPKMTEDEERKLVSMGVDVSGGGTDLTVIQVVRGMRALDPIVVPKPTTDKIVDRVEELMLHYRVPPSRVRVDSTGLGIGVADFLRRKGYPIIGINFSQRAVQNLRFVNARAEMYWQMADKFRHGHISIPKDPYLKRDLSDIRWEEEKHSRRIKIEAKEDIRDRNGYSPDRADALAMALYGLIGPLNELPRGEMVRIRSSGTFGRQLSTDQIIGKISKWRNWPGPSWMRR